MSRGHQEVRVDRRHWMRGMIRSAVLGIIALMTTYLAARRLDGPCPRLTTACGSCRLLTLCRQPAAEEKRRAAMRKESC